MDRDLAERTTESLAAADAALVAAFRHLDDAPETAQLAELKHRLGWLIALVYSGVTLPIYREHPGLCPEGLEGTLAQNYPPELDWPFPPAPPLHDRAV